MTLLHLSPNVITLRSLLHLRAVITFRSSTPVKKDARLDRYRSSRVPVSVSVSVSVSVFFSALSTYCDSATYFYATTSNFIK